MSSPAYASAAAAWQQPGVLRVLVYHCPAFALRLLNCCQRMSLDALDASAWHALPYVAFSPCASVCGGPSASSQQ